MRVMKRSGRIEDVKFDKVTNRISKLSMDYLNVDKYDAGRCFLRYDNIKTHEIDTLSAEICIGMITSDPDYEVLATRIVASNIKNEFLYIFQATKCMMPVLSLKKLRKFHLRLIHADPERDYQFGYFGLKTLERDIFRR